VNPIKKEKPKKKKKKNAENDKTEEKDENIKNNNEEEEEEDTNAENPLPGFIDPISLEEVVKPAISPHGHVMGYSNWVRCLTQNPKNICPFTKKTVKKRDLIVLTWENIEQYRDKIVST